MFQSYKDDHSENSVRHEPRILHARGLITSYIALTVVSEQFGMGKNMVAGFQHLMQAAPDHFKMIFEKPGPGATQKEIEDYSSLPGMAMMVAGIWVAHLFI